MNPLVRLSLIAFLLCAGCAHKAKHFDTPDAAPLLAKHADVVRHFAKARVAQTKAVASHAEEGAQIITVERQLDTPEFRNAPPELRAAIAAIKTEVAQHKVTHAATATHIEEATHEIRDGEAAAQEIGTKYGPEYLAKVEDLVARLNTTETKWAKDSQALWWYRGHLLLCSALAAGALLIGLLAWLGKLGGKAAVIAAKIA